MMAEGRESKRIRQACQNCRRKKTRCSGERPVCAFCERLRQECRYEDGPLSQENSLPMDSSTNESTLAARVALLESKLSLFDHVSNDFWTNPGADANERNANKTLATAESVRTQRSNASHAKFKILPPESVLRSIVDTYFAFCHNQPYCYFVESHFREKLEKGELPDYLLMAVVALAGRFSWDPFFDDEQLIAAEIYSRTAWNEVFDISFSEAGALDLAIVQATNMLAVVDFTAGKHKLAWVKIGLAVRFAQSLQLANEPSPALSMDEKAERSLTFWSVYLLDRLVSCGHNRPPTIADGDCNVPLPTDVNGFASRTTSDAPMLQAFYDVPDATLPGRMSFFASTIFMASVLGRLERLLFNSQRSNEPYPPWHARSEYMAIYSLLLSFEAYSDAVVIDFATAIDQFFPFADVEQTQAGHFIFSIILYHMNQCLLHHPFLLRTSLDGYKTRPPPSFLKSALARGLEHARLLTDVLSVLKEKGITVTSFYGYACTVAATIHTLFKQHEDLQISASAHQSFESSIEFLRHGQHVWSHYPRMISALIDFRPDPTSTAALVGGTILPASPHQRVVDPSLEFLWKMLDYGWLSDVARSASDVLPNTASSPEVPVPNNEEWTDPYDHGLNDDLLIDLPNFSTSAFEGPIGLSPDYELYQT